MIVLCKKDSFPFKKGDYYKAVGIFSIFDTNDFITIETNIGNKIRFRLNKSSEYIEDYIGLYENYFYDYFIDVLQDRKEKLDKLDKLTNL